jgi:hypothetical protein
MNTSTEQMTPERADWNARCFVNGMKRHGVTGKMEPASGEFSSHFLRHPWVRDAVAEGWGKELRGHLILAVKRRIMMGQSHNDIDALMPPKEWVDYAKQQAARYAKAAEFQKANTPGGDMSGWIAKLLRSNRERKEGQAA